MLLAIGSLKQEVESLADLDHSAELLIRLLCAVPGWGEKNVQVWLHHCSNAKCHYSWIFGMCYLFIFDETGPTASHRSHHSYSLDCETVSKTMCCTVPFWYEAVLVFFSFSSSLCCSRLFLQWFALLVKYVRKSVKPGWSNMCLRKRWVEFELDVSVTVFGVIKFKRSKYR